MPTLLRETAYGNHDQVQADQLRAGVTPMSCKYDPGTLPLMAITCMSCNIVVLSITNPQSSRHVLDEGCS